MIYGAVITYEPFQYTSGVKYRMQRDTARKTGIYKRLFPMVPFMKERMGISMAFMLCLSIGIALAMLGGFHLYLVLTGQTTIEFHANWVNKRKAKRLNKRYKNPYDLGTKRNWQQIYGSSSNWLVAFIVPSNREPEFLPLPLPGKEGRRRKVSSTTKSSSSTATATTTTTTFTTTDETTKTTNTTTSTVGEMIV